MLIGTETHFSHFQSYENSPIFGMDSPIFGMNVQTGDEPLNLFFPLLYAFHPSGKSFKIQIKELRWIYLMESKRKIKIKNQNSKESREIRNHWTS